MSNPKQPNQPRRVLKEVSIPVSKSQDTPATRDRLSKSSTRPTEQESSTDSLSLDNSDYETPGTSISTTPAVSVNRGKMSGRRGLNKATTPSQNTPSVIKRPRDVVSDSDSDSMALDMDAEIALQMQLEDEMHAQRNKRQKTDEDEDEDMHSEEEPVASASRRKKLTYNGKGKGKAKSEEADNDVDESRWLSELSSPPPYVGKGKGKAQTVSNKRGRTARSSAKKKGRFTEDDFLDDEESDGGEFQLDEHDDDLDSLLDLEETLDSSDMDEEPLMSITARLKQRAAARPAKVARGHKKQLTYDEKTEAHERRARFAHIEDKWERKRAMNRERAEQQHPKLRTMWDDLKKIPVLETQKAEQPQSITRRLKPFQLEGLSWMIRQEKTHYKGGLLGDEMGMGKTIQAVSLIMSDYPAKHPTLVCVPPVALMQWTNEIREYTDNKLKVLVYHGTNAKCKKMSVKELKAYDVIMVSYNSLESLHRKETSTLR